MRVILAEDEHISRTILARVVANRDHEVIECEDGEDAWDAYQKGPVSFIIVDWMMPKCDGLELTRRIRAHPDGHNTVILMATSQGLEDDLATALKEGIDDYIQKPFDPLQLDARLAICEQAVENRLANRRLQEDLAKAQHEESLADVAAGFSHEINNTLGPIVAYTQLVQRSFEKGDKEYERLTSVLKACSRAKTMVEQIHVYARADNAASTNVDVAKLFSDVKTKLYAFEHDGKTCSIEIASGTPQAMGDSRHLAIAFLNMARNAFDASEKGAEIFLRARGVDGGKVALEVTDSGTGISDDVKDRMFEPFFSSKERAKLTGLGLAVVKGVVTTHKGKIEVDTELGKGTTMRLILPAAS